MFSKKEKDGWEILFDLFLALKFVIIERKFEKIVENSSLKEWMARIVRVSNTTLNRVDFN